MYGLWGIKLDYISQVSNIKVDVSNGKSRMLLGSILFDAFELKKSIPSLDTEILTKVIHF